MVVLHVTSSSCFPSCFDFMLSSSGKEIEFNNDRRRVCVCAYPSMPATTVRVNNRPRPSGLFLAIKVLYLALNWDQATRLTLLVSYEPHDWA